MKLSVNEFLSLDGVMQGPGGPDEDRSGGFDRGGWAIPLFDQDTGEIVTSWFDRGSAILLGRTTYDMMSAYWSQVTDPDNGVAAALNGRQKYVASTTLTDPAWNNTTVLSSNVRWPNSSSSPAASCRCTAVAGWHGNSTELDWSTCTG